MDDAAFADLSFEDALKQLEAIVRQLESGDVPLDDSISLRLSSVGRARPVRLSASARSGSVGSSRSSQRPAPWLWW